MRSINLTSIGKEVLRKRYVARNSRGEIIETPEQRFHRVARAVAEADRLFEADAQIGAKAEAFEDAMVSLSFLPNIHGQRIYVPNRNIASIGRFRLGAMRAYVNIQIPEGLAEGPVVQKAKSLVTGLHDQHRSIILQQPEIFGIKEAKGGDWRFLRIKFRIWPGQGSLIENTFRQSVIALMKNLYPDYAE